jgi:rubrerythrin
MSAAGAALVLAGCGGRPARKLAGDPADLRFLDAALDLERAQITMYLSALKTLRGTDADLARQILAHEHAHADAIAEAVRELGGRPRRPAAKAFGGAPGTAGDARALMRAAARAEDRAASLYAAAIPRLANARLKSTFGAIMTSEAEHAAALRLP